MKNLHMIPAESFGRAFVAYEGFINLTGSLEGGHFLTQLYYWSTGNSAAGTKGHDPDGWIYKTGKEWVRETKVSVDLQKKVRQKLVKARLLEEKKCGIPCKLYYRLNMENLAKAMTKQFIEASDEVSTVSEILQPETVERPQFGDFRKLGSENPETVIGKSRNDLYTEITTENTSKNTSCCNNRPERSQRAHANIDINPRFSGSTPEKGLGEELHRSCLVESHTLAAAERFLGFEVDRSTANSQQPSAQQPTAEAAIESSSAEPIDQQPTAEEIERECFPAKEKKIESTSAESIPDPKRPSLTVPGGGTKNCATGEADRLARIDQLVNAHRPPDETEEETAALAELVAEVEAKLRASAISAKQHLQEEPKSKPALAKSGSLKDKLAKLSANAPTPDPALLKDLNNRPVPAEIEARAEIKGWSESRARDEARMAELVGLSRRKHFPSELDSLVTYPPEEGYEAHESTYPQFPFPLHVEVEKDAFLAVLEGTNEQVGNACPLEVMQRIWETYQAYRPLSWFKAVRLEDSHNLRQSINASWRLLDKNLPVVERAIAFEEMFRRALLRLNCDSYYWRQGGHEQKNINWILSVYPSGGSQLSKLADEWAYTPPEKRERCIGVLMRRSESSAAAERAQRRKDARTSTKPIGPEQAWAMGQLIYNEADWE